MTRLVLAAALAVSALGLTASTASAGVGVGVHVGRGGVHVGVGSPYVRPGYGPYVRPGYSPYVRPYPYVNPGYHYNPYRPGTYFVPPVTWRYGVNYNFVGINPLWHPTYGVYYWVDAWGNVYYWYTWQY